jgi:hypothetical protein
MTSGETFGPELRKIRERAGVTLEAVAHVTKIHPALLLALERGDLSRWPGGLYRRAFFREYLRAIGLRPDPALIDLVRFLPAAGDRPSPVDGDRLRLSIEPASPWPERARRVGAAALDLLVVVATATAVAAVPGAGFWPAAAIVAAGYAAASTTCVGTSVGLWCLTPGRFARRERRLSFETAEVTPIGGEWLATVLGASLAAMAPDPTLERTA